MDNIKNKLLLLYFQICGFCHLTNLKDFSLNKCTRFLICWSYCHLLLLTTTVSVAIYCANWIFVMRDSISTVTDILQWMLPVLSQYVIIIESLCTHKIKCRFWHRIHYMDTFLLNTSLQMKQISINKFFIKCVAILIITLAVDILTVIHIHSDKVWRNHILISFYTFVVCRSQILFFVFFTDTLKYRTKMLTTRIKQIRINDKNRLNLLRCCKKSFDMLWLLTEDINQAFGLLL